MTGKVEQESKESRKLAEETAAKWRQHPKAEVHREFDATTGTGDEKATQAELHAADGFVVIDTHGQARMDRDQFVVFRKMVEQAFQVVA